MRTELTFWDHITLSLALLFVVVFIVMKLMRLFSSSSTGCGNCSASTTCSAPLTKKRLECKHDVHKVSVSSIHKNSTLKSEKKTQDPV